MIKEILYHLTIDSSPNNFIIKGLFLDWFGIDLESMDDI